MGPVLTCWNPNAFNFQLDCGIRIVATIHDNYDFSAAISKAAPHVFWGFLVVLAPWGTGPYGEVIHTTSALMDQLPMLPQLSGSSDRPEFRIGIPA